MKTSSVWLCAWGEHNDFCDVESITEYVEKNRVRLRSKYLEFIYELERKVVNRQSMLEHHEVTAFTSLWSMSLLAEKSQYKSPEIMDCLKLLALEEIIVKRNLQTIEIIGVARKSVQETIAVLCNNLVIDVRFSDSGMVSVNELATSKSFHNRIPYVLQGAIALIRIVFSRWQLRAAKTQDWFANENAVFFMSYFINLDYDAYKNGRFESHHWGTLPEMLASSSKSMNWIHHFITHNHIPNTKVGLDWIARFNQNTNQKNIHTFLDSYLNLTVIIKALYRWLGSVWTSYWLRDIEVVFQPKDSVLNLWPILKDDWYKSFRGVVAAQNALCYELIDVAMANIPKQNTGLYLYEGHTWEPAFIHAWRKHGHGELVAVAHSTVRFWDLRYFDDPRIFDNINNTSISFPDKIAVNGPLARKTFLDAGCPEKYLIDVEALRYLHFADEQYLSQSMNLRKIDNRKIKLLLLGDIKAVNNHPLFQLLGALSKDIKSKLEITVKPHPANNIESTDYVEIGYKVTIKPLREILGMFDVAFGANQTSANLDAYLFGLPVIIHKDASSINFSPLLDIKDVKFVSNSFQLGDILSKIKPIKAYNGPDLFFLDNSLTRWKKLLKVF